MFFALASYPILGAGIKYIDAAYDEKAFSKTSALLLAPLLGILWAYTMMVDAVSATILLSVLLGVMLKGKIDNLAHLAGLLVIFAFVIVAGVQLLLLPLVVLTAAALLDEVGNDYMDKIQHKLSLNKLTHRFIVTFFDQRWVLKVTILGLATIGILPFYFFIAMVLFDYAYLLVRVMSQVKQGTLVLPKLRVQYIEAAKAVISQSECRMRGTPIQSLSPAISPPTTYPVAYLAANNVFMLHGR